MTEDLRDVDRSWKRTRAKRELLLGIGRTLARWRIVRVRNGHYYSPVPLLKELEADAERIFDDSRRTLPGIEIDAQAQLALLDRFARFYADQPFPETPQPDIRYFFDNYWYNRFDALILYSFIRHFRPQQIVEVGSGFSSAVMLDTNERFMNRSMRLTFVEPESGRLRKLLKPGDREAVTIVERRIQQLDFAMIDGLAANDILFIDSSHVSKAGSDVNHILFELLPRLKSGVLVHFHDIRYPFEYPKEWFALGVSWNEAYILRAFLLFNKEFTIEFWNDYVLKFHADAVRERMPMCPNPPALACMVASGFAVSNGSNDVGHGSSVSRTALVTGATSGIGAATAEAIARHGWTVVIVGRNAPRCESTVARIRQTTANPDIHCLVGDLSSQADVRRIAGEFLNRFEALHVLVNNAGGLFLDRRESADGIELTFALNHLAPFLLTNLLLEVIRGSERPRIVNVSSAGHRLSGGLRRNDLEWRQARYRGFKVYHHSKLANLLFTYELARRMQGSGVTVNAADPGLVATNIGRDNGKFWMMLRPVIAKILGWRYVDAHQGARTVVHLAASPAVEHVTGRYFANEREVPSSAASQNAETAGWLWQASAELTGLS